MVFGSLVMTGVVLFYAALVVAGIYVVKCLHRIRLDVSRMRELMERDALAGRSGSTSAPGDGG
jgi:hypothetical protein